MNPIAQLFAELGFKVNRKGLDQFKGQLKTTAADIEKTTAQSTRAVKRNAKGSTQALQHVFSNFSKKSKPNLEEVRKSWAGLQDEMQKPLSPDQMREYNRAQDRLITRANDIRKEQQGIRKRVRAERLKDEKALQEALRKMDARSAAEAKKNQEKIAASRKKATESTKKHNARLTETRNKLLQISKTYDKTNFKLREMRDAYSFVNQEFKKGNITLEQREQQLRAIIEQYRRLQAAQAATARGRVGAAGGIYAGGEDPRQVGNHRIISAIHSDVGLGAMMGGFAIAQSSRFYQEYVGLQQGLNAAMGDVEQGGKELEWLIRTTNKLGISLGAASEGYKTFAAATQGTELAGKETRQIFESVSSYAKVLNMSADDTKGVFRALTQMVSKGRVQAEELDLTRLAV